MKRLISFAIILVLVLGFFSSATDAQMVFEARSRRFSVRKDNFGQCLQRTCVQNRD